MEKSWCGNHETRRETPEYRTYLKTVRGRVMEQMKFDHYYCYAELENFLKSLAQEHPGLTRLESAGKSGEGREIWVMTLSDMSTGDPEDKPAIYIDGNFHAGEVTGSMINLYTIRHTLENYGNDERITKLLQRYTLYVIPRVSPDGAEMYLTTPETLRSVPRPYPFPNPDEQEGLYPADIDGDGHILMMRVKDDTGEWKVSPRDPRAMVRRAPDEDEGTFYRVYTEGFLREHQGGEVKVAPGKWGLDFNRNFPFGWVPEVQQSGAGEFPLSEPETRAVAEFVVKHPNISLALTYHTTGGVILRVPGAHSHTKSPREDIQAMIAIGEMGAEETGYPCVPCYEEFYGGGDDFSKGAYDDWLFDHRGILAYTVETWNLAQRAGIHQFPRKEKTPKEQEEDYLKMLSWNDRELGGKGFENWRTFNHPQLGEVEIGGWYSKYVVQNAPPMFLEAECHKNSMFIFRAAATLPRLELASVKQRALGDEVYEVYEVSALVKNVGFLPTFGSHQAKQLAQARPLVAELCIAGEKAGREVIGKARKEIGHLDGRSGSTSAFSLWSSRSAGVNRVTKVSWVVKAQQGSEITIKVEGERAGYVTEVIKLE
ncbi:MAG TPA: carboxypeptidase [Firmicutes bacterium]|nr:carboxypeptidase [Bacillota bacterium]